MKTFSCVSEILGHRVGAHQAAADEPVHHVDVWKHHLDLPDHDGVHDVLPTHPGALQLLTEYDCNATYSFKTVTSTLLLLCHFHLIFL